MEVHQENTLQQLGKIVDYHNEYAEIKRPDLLQRRTNWQKYNNHHRDNDNNGVHLPEYK